ncbi:MAG: Lsr2 family protein [Actinobacteria bacterium]|nr:Lsr2 family protein [Actinomycetota bacterium]
MVDDFVIARNPQEDSSLPYLLRLPLGPTGVVLKVRDTWPRTAKVYCHPAEGWPDDAEVVERVPVRSCVRRGAAVDLVLDRGRESRSQFVFTKARGRDMIFWQSARTARQARPNVSVPTRRASGLVLEIVVDSHERYPWRFNDQQATTVRRALAAGDYGVEVDGTLVATVERKSLPDLVGTLTGGKLRYLLAALADVPHSALVVEDRYSAVFKLDRVRPAVVAEGLAEAQVRFPEVPIVFCDTRPLAQEWTYRFLGAALAHHLSDAPAGELLDALPTGPSLAPAPPTTAEVRAWAQANGLSVAAKGRLRPEVVAAYEDAHPHR